MPSLAVRACLRPFALALVFCSLASAQGRYLWSHSDPAASAQNDILSDLALGPQGEGFFAGRGGIPPAMDALFLAFDPYGALIWRRAIDMGGSELAAQVRFDASNSALYACGTKWTGARPHWALWRLDPHSGAIVWQQTHLDTPPLGGVALSLAIDAAGGLLVAGYAETSPHHWAHLARFDANGALSWSWAPPFPSGAYTSESEVVAVPGGGALLTTYVDTGQMQYRLDRVDMSGVPTWRRVLGTSVHGLCGPYFDAAGDFVYAFDAPGSGGGQIVELDSAGNPAWTRDANALFGGGAYTIGLAVEAQGDVVAVGSSGVLVRLDPAGNTRWSATLPSSQWFDPAPPSALVLASNGDEIVRYRHSPGLYPGFDALARWDAAGNFLWSQALRGAEPGDSVHTFAIAPVPQGGVIVGGYVQPASSPASYGAFVAALHGQSHSACAGDGSAGPCPCHNEVPAGSPGGCSPFVPPASGLGGRLDDQGIASLGNDTLRFYAAGTVAGQLTILLQGALGPGSRAVQDGLLCLAGTPLRLYVGAATSTFVDLPPAGGQRVSARSAALGEFLHPASTHAYQLYYRRPPGVCGSGLGNLTNAIVVEWSQ